MTEEQKEYPDSSLKQKGDADYVLVAHGCWITVEDLSLHIRGFGGAVDVTVYPLGEEDGVEIASMIVPFSGEQ